MTVHHPCHRIPLRAARWSATHPWRAILGLARPGRRRGRAGDRRPDRGDHRRRLPARRVRPGRRDGRRGRPRRPRRRERPDHATRRRTPGRARPREAAAARRARGADRASTASTRSPSRSGTPTGRRYLVSVQLARDHEDAGAAAGRSRPRSRPTIPDLDVRQAGDLTHRRGDRRPGRRRPLLGRGLSLPVTLVLMLLAFGALIAAGIPVLLAATSVAATIGILAPLSHLVHAEAHRHQHDRADRHGGRRRLLALLPQARARGARRRPQHPATRSRSRPRPPATRSWSPGRP